MLRPTRRPAPGGGEKAAGQHVRAEKARDSVRAPDPPTRVSRRHFSTICQSLPFLLRPSSLAASQPSLRPVFLLSSSFYRALICIVSRRGQRRSQQIRSSVVELRVCRRRRANGERPGRKPRANPSANPDRCPSRAWALEEGEMSKRTRHLRERASLREKADLSDAGKESARVCCTHRSR